VTQYRAGRLSEDPSCIQIWQLIGKTIRWKDKRQAISDIMKFWSLTGRVADRLKLPVPEGFTLEP
jgi:hypothetical protein